MTDFPTEHSPLASTGAHRMTDTTTQSGAEDPFLVREAWPGADAGAEPWLDMSAEALVAAAARFRERVHVLRDRHTGAVGACFDDGGPRALESTHALIATLPPIYPEWLGSRD